MKIIAAILIPRLRRPQSPSTRNLRRASANFGPIAAPRVGRRSPPSPSRSHRRRRRLHRPLFTASGRGRRHPDVLPPWLWFTLAPTQMDLSFSSLQPGHHTLMGNMLFFGRVIKVMGMVRSMEHVSVGEADLPTTDIVVVDCGELPEGASDGVVNFFKHGDMYPDWPNDLDEKPAEISWRMNAVDSAKSFGNENFKKKDYEAALKMYRKAMRYLDLCWEKEEIDEEKSSALRKTKLIILTNSSACNLKLGDLKGALLDADFALREGDGETKSFFPSRTGTHGTQ